MKRLLDSSYTALTNIADRYSFLRTVEEFQKSRDMPCRDTFLGRSYKAIFRRSLLGKLSPRQLEALQEGSEFARTYRELESELESELEPEHALIIEGKLTIAKRNQRRLARVYFGR